MFATTYAVVCSITITSPNGGEKLSGTQSISWTNNSDCSPAFNIQYISDNGTFEDCNIGVQKSGSDNGVMSEGVV
jgi:hypothetical protein